MVWKASNYIDHASISFLLLNVASIQVDSKLPQHSLLQPRASLIKQEPGGRPELFLIIQLRPMIICPAVKDPPNPHQDHQTTGDHARIVHRFRGGRYTVGKTVNDNRGHDI